MPNLTSPDNLPYPLSGEPASPIQENFEDLAVATQLALGKRQRFSYDWVDDAARIVQTGMVEGSEGFVRATKTNWTYNGGSWRLSLGHIEFTASKSIPGGNGTLIGTLTVDPTTTTDSTLVVPVADGVIEFTNAGVYSVTSFSVVVGGPVTALFFLQLSTTGLPNYDTGRLTRGGLTPSDDTITMGMPNLRIEAAGARRYLTFSQQTGAARTVNTRLRITRLG